MIKAIIFDVDGTLVDSVDLHARSWQRVLADFGHPFSFETIRSQIGKGGDQLLPALLDQDAIERDGAAMEEARGKLFKAEYLDQVRPFPGVADLFKRLIEEGRRVALGSSGKPEEMAHHKRLLGIEKMDLVQTSSEDAERSKPYPDIFNAALERLGVAATEAIVIGDTPYDATAAGRAGMGSVGVLCGGFAADDLRQAGCLALYDDPQDLLARLAGSPLLK